MYPLSGSPPYISDQPPGSGNFHSIKNCSVPRFLRGNQENKPFSCYQNQQGQTWYATWWVRVLSPTVKHHWASRRLYLPTRNIDINWIDSKRGRIAPAGSQQRVILKMKSRELIMRGDNLLQPAFKQTKSKFMMAGPSTSTVTTRKKPFYEHTPIKWKPSTF